LTLGAILGFLVLNFPKGRIFLGDGGAYWLGGMAAMIGILLPLRNPELSPLLAPMVLAYPILELLVSMGRRLVRRRRGLGTADRLHLHSLLYRSHARLWARRLGRPWLRNPLTALSLWPLSLIAGTFGTL